MTELFSQDEVRKALVNTLLEPGGVFEAPCRGRPAAAATGALALVSGYFDNADACLARVGKARLPQRASTSR